MSRLCPSDVYKVYKRGANVRIDTTLLGFDNATWQRGNRTYIFKGQRKLFALFFGSTTHKYFSTGETATMIEIDHDTHEVLIEQLHSSVGNVVAIPPPPGSVRARLSAPVVTNNIDMDKISFERNKSGIWGWRSEKNESINGYDCKVYGASNVEFITRTRTEHVNEQMKVYWYFAVKITSLDGLFIAGKKFSHSNPQLLRNSRRRISEKPRTGHISRASEFSLHFGLGICRNILWFLNQASVTSYWRKVRRWLSVGWC